MSSKIIDKLSKIRDKFDWLNSKAAFAGRSEAEKQAIYTGVAVAILAGNPFDVEDE